MQFPEDMNLETFKLARNLSPRAALDLGMALTAHRRESDMVRFMAMALHFASWTLATESTLGEYETLLSHLSPETNPQLLDALSFPFTFSVRGEQDRLPAELIRNAESAAREWRRVLLAKEVDALKLHRRCLRLLRSALESDVKSQRMLMAELHVILMCNQSEHAQSLATAGRSSVPAKFVEPQARRPVRSNPDPEGDTQPVHVFSSPAEAIQFILAQAAALGAPLSTPLLTDDRGPAEKAPPTNRMRVMGPSLRVFNPRDAFAVLQKLPPPSPNEGNNQQRRMLENMANDSGVRALTETPPGNPLHELYGRFPHFKGPLDYISRYLALAACGDAGRPARIAPMLLRGCAGTGKTYFAQELARVLGTHFVERDLAVTSEAFVIAGFDPSWKGSKPGIVFEALVNGKTANPVILLNEVDKAKVTGNNNSPLAALYALLEPTSAEHFTDEFIPSVPLDTSGVIWLLTANDGDIPAPILSRLEVFEIAQPTQDECRAIAASVWESVCRKSLPSGHGFPAQLPDELLTPVSALSPRVMRRVLTRAAGEAAFAGRKHLLYEDIVTARAGSPSAAESRSIGFLA